ncbi:MAG: DNA repair protein RadC [Rhizobiaceae bacterium]
MRNQYGAGLIPVHTSDLQLLKTIIGKRRGKRETETLAIALLKRFGRLGRVLRANEAEFAGITGFGPDIASEFHSTREIVQAVTLLEALDRPVLDKPERLWAFLRSILAGEVREQFHVLHLDKAFRLIGHDLLQIGTVDHVTVYPREVMHKAIAQASASIILVHNHPSGNAKPSRGDRCMTDRLVTIGNHLGIRVLDHLIVGESENFSFRQSGLLGGDAIALTPAH